MQRTLLQLDLRYNELCFRFRLAGASWNSVIAVFVVSEFHCRGGSYIEIAPRSSPRHRASPDQSRSHLQSNLDWSIVMTAKSIDSDGVGLRDLLASSTAWCDFLRIRYPNCSSTATLLLAKLFFQTASLCDRLRLRSGAVAVRLKRSLSRCVQHSDARERGAEGTQILLECIRLESKKRKNFVESFECVREAQSVET